MSKEWRKEQNRCQREIERHQNADKSYLDEGVQLCRTGPQRPTAVRAAGSARITPLVNFVLSNCTWEDGKVVATFRETFEMLAETATAAALAGAADESKSSKTEIWLGN